MRQLFYLLLFVVSGCASFPTAFDTDSVMHQVHERLGTGNVVNQPIVPQEFTAQNPLNEDHAVLLALWNNAAFQEALVDLQLTRADLLQAGLLPNPEVVYFFHVPDKPFKYAAEFPIEALWLRPLRLKAAAAENTRSCERLTQLALDLIRDTRQAYADLVLARERVRVAEEAVKLRVRIADLAEARLKAGDISKQETATASIDAQLARQDAIRIGVEVPVAEERLKNLMGIPELTSALPVVPRSVTLSQEWKIDDLVSEACTSRPDLLATELAVQAADERLRLARTSWFRFLGVLDASSGRDTGHEFGPAFRITLPLFNHNQGAIARAEAERELLNRRLTTIRYQIITETRQAFVRYQQTDKELTTLRKVLQPEVEAAIKRSEKAFEAGNASYLIVLETTRQLIDTYNRDAQLVAERQRAWAELERCVGRRLTPPETSSTP